MPSVPQGSRRRPTGAAAVTVDENFIGPCQPTTAMPEYRGAPYSHSLSRQLGMPREPPTRSGAQKQQNGENNCKAAHACFHLRNINPGPQKPLPGPVRPVGHALAAEAVAERVRGGRWPCRGSRTARRTARPRCALARDAAGGAASSRSGGSTAMSEYRANFLAVEER
jgi:hypothetical protein